MTPLRRALAASRSTHCNLVLITALGGSTGAALSSIALPTTLMSSPLPAASLLAPLRFKVTPPAVWSVPFSGGSVAVSTSGGSGGITISALGAPSQYAAYLQIADPPSAPPPSSGGGIGGTPPSISPTPSLPPSTPGLPAVATVSKVLKLLPLPARMRVPGIQFMVTVQARDASGAQVTTPVRLEMTAAAGIPVITSANKMTLPPAVNPESSNLFTLDISHFDANDGEREIICRYTSVPGANAGQLGDYLCAVQGALGKTTVVRVPDSGRGHTVQLLAMNREGFSAPVNVEPRGAEIQVLATQTFNLFDEVPQRTVNHTATGTFQPAPVDRFTHGPSSANVSGRLLPADLNGTCSQQFVVWAAVSPVAIANLRTQPAEIISRVVFTPYSPVVEHNPNATQPPLGCPQIYRQATPADSFAPGAVTSANRACGAATYDSNGRDLSTQDRLIFDVTYRLGVRETPPCERPAH